MSRVLGIMSGTSIDGADYAVCDVAEKGVKLRRHWHVAFPKKLRDRLRDAAKDASTTYELGQLHHDLGRFYAAGAKQLGSSRVQVAALHGQTVFHDGPRGATLQIGEPAWLAGALRAPVVSNFRAADLAAGGQGAPLATLFHARTFAERGRHICVNNLGGISNVTSLDWRGKQLRIQAFDTGPANMLMDLAVQAHTKGQMSFDRDGKLAKRGTPNERLLARWLSHPFFQLPPPKSTGREAFGEPFFKRALKEGARLSGSDLLATLNEFTARSIALNYLLHLPSTPDRVILCGGGASNPALVGAIQQNLPVPVVRCDTLGWPAQTIEPAAFALLAWMRLRGEPGNIPDTTGAKRAVLLGQITAP